jgi:hypothetical protein
MGWVEWHSGSIGTDDMDFGGGRRGCARGVLGLGRGIAVCRGDV